MDALRQQLGETQGALHEKIFQARQLRVDLGNAQNMLTNAQNELAREKEMSQGKQQLLEGEIMRLRQINQVLEASAKKSKSPAQGNRQQGGNGTLVVNLEDDRVIITRSRMMEADAMYNKVIEELAEKTQLYETLVKTTNQLAEEAKLRDSLQKTTELQLSEKDKLCDTLQRQLQAQVQAQNGGKIEALSGVKITNGDVINLWGQLRAHIRAISIESLHAVNTETMSDAAKREFEQLSENWPAYMLTKDLTCYIFRAVIWRYLDSNMLSQYCRAYGRDFSSAAKKVQETIAAGVSESDYHDWRARTGVLLHEACKPDLAIQSELTQTLLEILRPYTSRTEDVLKGQLAKIVKLATRLGAMLTGGRFYAVLMSDMPDSNRMNGFTLNMATMDVKGRLGGGDDGENGETVENVEDLIVDLMISPCLLTKKEGNWNVLVKSEIIWRKDA
ncbi:hypothetical protein GGR54DRAFT_596873 [Hypoxylon sp. NC1633]|nr:hypothetical protein GGR54DRAFT_596873 [Hypoxylon sp. NC1633]